MIRSRRFLTGKGWLRIMLNKIKNNRIINSRAFTSLIIILLAIYPMRFCNRGLDLWDTGFNLINFKYDDIGSVGSMNFFAYFLANQIGHVFMYLPIANTLLGARIVCSLFISAEVVICSLFCIGKLKLNRWMVFAGEFLAVSICYSPSVILYNHVSFLLLLISVMLIYIGLMEEKKYCLFLAGVCLGLDVYVRFSNAVFSMLILAVFYYLYLKKVKLPGVVKCTVYCILGFAVSFCTVFTGIGIRYGFNAYYDGIAKLFSMSETVETYSAYTMLRESIMGYLNGGKLLLAVVVTAVLAMLFYHLFSWKFGNANTAKIKLTVSILFSGCLIVFLVGVKLIGINPSFYGMIYYSAGMLADLVILFFVVSFLNKECDLNQKLLAALLFLWVVVLSVGSGTGISPVINSMFLGTPVLFAKLYDGIRKMFEDNGKCLEQFHQNGGLLKNVYKYFEMCEFKVFLTNIFAVLLIVVFLQCSLFGAVYVYEEALNGISGNSEVADNRVLSGMKMSEERAGFISGLSEYVSGNNLYGSDCIVYGYAPGLAYALELKPVIPSWPDLESYSAESMSEDVEKLCLEIEEGKRMCPVLVIDNEPSTGGVPDNPSKIRVIEDLKEQFDYEEVYTNGRYSIWRSI